MSISPSTGAADVVVGNSGGANGLYYDTNGQLVSMDGNARQVSRRDRNDLNVITEVLAAEWDGRRFNSPITS